MTSPSDPMLPDDARQAAPAEPTADPAPTAEPARRRRWPYTILLFVLLFALSPVFLILTGTLETVAQTLLGGFVEAAPPVPVEVAEVKPEPAPRNVSSDLTFTNSPYHPDRLFRPYFGAQPSKAHPAPTTRLIAPFQDLLDLFMKRQGQDDNFTIRVYDNRNGKLLELYALTDARRAYEQTGEANWRAIDKLRRSHTGRLVAKYEKLGYPKEAISAKWGRRNQVHEARQREAPFIEYEMRLAQYLGLSLLATEIGTVETFNQDSLISSVGARSRYQMMPYILSESNVHRYKLETSYGKNVDVHEEWHPLLTMEPAFVLLRGYVNAVGHEVPGMSAYHTGPGNIFKLYRMFLAEAEDDLRSANTTVLDAYVWAVTEGFETVSSGSSFRQKSQGYVPAGYGSLRAVEDLVIDTLLTQEVERVQLKAGESILLGELLGALVKSGAHLRWARGTSSLGLYERFRRLNPHFDLPPAQTDGGVPPEGNVRLVAQVDDVPVRFFLPLRAARVLAGQGLDVIDRQASFRFDRTTYRRPTEGELTEADIAYSRLIRDIGRFGFTPANKRRLSSIARQFASLAARNPSHYRRTQLAIIKIHQGLWAYKGWDTLAQATATAIKGTIQLENVAPRPPDQATPSAPDSAGTQ